MPPCFFLLGLVKSYFSSKCKVDYISPLPSHAFWVLPHWFEEIDPKCYRFLETLLPGERKLYANYLFYLVFVLTRINQL